MEKDRFFTLEQKLKHAEAIGGYKCEGMIDPYTPCNEIILEAHHATSFSKGGETTEENLFLFGKVCHAIFHLISDEPWSARLIYNRMSEEEKLEFKRRGYGV